MKNPKNFMKKTDAEKSAWVLHKIFGHKRKDAKPQAEKIVNTLNHVTRYKNIENVDMDVVNYIDGRYPNVFGLGNTSYLYLYNYWLKKGIK